MNTDEIAEAIAMAEEMHQQYFACMSAAALEEVRLTLFKLYEADARLKELRVRTRWWPECLQRFRAHKAAA